MIHKRHSLAGTCGIPAEEERIYITVDSIAPDSPTEGPERPQRIYWPDGRSWRVESIYLRQNFGRAIFGNLCVRFDVCILKRRKTVWWEDGKWFVKRGSGMAVAPE